MVEAMLIEKGYKSTEIGVIPEDWKVKTLAELTDPSRTIRYGIVQPGHFTNDGCLMLRSQDYSKGWVEPSSMHRVSERLALQYRNAMLRHGDLIMTIVGANTGQVVEAPYWLQGAVLSRSTARIAFFEEDVSIAGFVKFYLQSESGRMQVSNYLKEGAQPVLSCADLYKFNIPYPPTKAEQTAIAEALNDADALITELEKLINKKKAIKQGAMQELLKPKEGWEIKKLGECVNVIGGGTPSSFNVSFWNGDINWLTPTEVGEKKYVYESVRKITEEGYANSSAKMLPIGTVLLTSRAGIGDLGILMNEGCTNQGFQSLIAKENTDNEFIYYLMGTLKNQLHQNASGSTFLEISPARLKQIEIVVPEKSEQIRIAQILSDMDAEIEALERKLDKHKMLKQGMMQNLLTGKIRLV